MNGNIVHATPALFTGGDMGARMRVCGRASSPLGPVECGPHSLRVMISTCLHSGLAMADSWGSDL